MASILGLEGAITLAFISYVYLAVFLCGIATFLLVFFLLNRRKKTFCGICAKRLQNDDNFCNFCGTATHRIVLPPASMAPVQPLSAYGQQGMHGYSPAPSWISPLHVAQHQTPQPAPRAVFRPPTTHIPQANYASAIEQPDYNCPQCNADLYFSDTFCGNCGGRLVPAVKQIQY
ncbi:hypothetical protein [Dictyobacter alpinus]|uniref:hypothetical protein n=1 Tax=Dictyobacter alpinus TaxID=2014873 RepID=UPI000F82535D|nr:hypothetical protein [Dictyobacter alpinus]